MAVKPAYPNPWSVLAKLVGVLVATGVLAAGVLMPLVGGLGFAANHESVKFLDTACHLQETPPPQKTRLYASDGKTLLATIFTQDRQPVPLTKVPKLLQQALIATEDRRFYSHHGVDMRGLLRSAVSTSGGDTQGGSTLTMQYVKQIRYYQAGNNLAKQRAAIAQNLNRKIEDAKCALYIENVKGEPKNTILDNYLNIAFFGENSYGIETAAQTYFGKDSDQLTLPESAMLVGLLRAPSQYDPFVNPDEARARRNEVLQNLVDVGDLTQAAAERYAATPVSLATTDPPRVHEGCANAPNNITNVGFFCDYAVNWLLSNKAVTDSQLRTGGLKIVTTLNAHLQDSMQARLATALPASSPTTAILPVVEPTTGNVLAMATSKKYGTPTSERDHSRTSLPIFSEYSAQGASTYKLFPLLTALSTGVPSSWELQTPPSYEGYTTKNCQTQSTATNGDAQETYNSNETLATATQKSSNTYFVGLADQLLGCNLQPIVDMAKSLGMKGLDQPSDERNQTVAQTIVNNGRAQQLVLGDIGTSPLEIAGAYAAVADKGLYNPPSPILSITDENGHAISVPRAPGTQVVSPQVALEAVQILEGDTKYPGTSATPFQNWYAKNSSKIAGKTGTSVAVVHGRATDQNASLWFVGMTPNYVASAALVNLNSPAAPVAGLPGISDPSHTAYGSYASGIWLKALQPTLQRQTWQWPQPGSVSGEPVPYLIGLTLSEARARLAAYHLKLAQLDPTIECASGVPIGSVAYSAPDIAPAGSTITVCTSIGEPQTIYTPPPPPTTPPGSGTGSGPGSGSGSSGGSGGTTPPGEGGSDPGGLLGGGGNGGGGHHHHGG